MLAAERVPHAVGRVVYVPKRDNAITNRLNKTKAERIADYEAEQIEQVKVKKAGKVPPQLPRYVLLPSFARGYINVTPHYNLQRKR
jgi:hypothetical protein